MDSKLLIILAIILFILIILNHVSVVVTPSGQEDTISKQFGYVQTPSNCSNVPGCCSLTQYGCCPDGVNSRIDTLGSNCPPTYNPGYNASNTNTIIQNNIPPQNIFIPPQNIIKPLGV
jgi:hypothetical protein